MYIIVLKAKYNWSFLMTKFNFLTIHQFQNALSKFIWLSLVQTDFPFGYIHSDSKAQEFQTPLAKVCYRFRIPDRLRVVPHFSSGIVERAKREGAWKSSHARKCDTRRGERNFLSPRVSPFLAWGDFHAPSRFARSTIPEEKWGTTRSLDSRSKNFPGPESGENLERGKGDDYRFA